jgi:chromosome segregation ATPase
VAEEVAEEEVPEEVAEEPAVEEVEEVDEEPEEEEADDEPVHNEPKIEVVGEPVEEEPPVEKPKKPAKDDGLKEKLAEKDKKLSNQSSELNYLTNKVIPKLKKENAELKSVKKELTDALEKSTRKYFDQLDINADLSNNIGKLGADAAVQKVRADKLENEVNSIKDDYEAKIADLNDKLANVNVDDIQKKNDNLTREVKDLKDKLSDARKENISLSDEVDKLRAEIIEFGNYKEEVEAQSKKEVDGFKSEISDLRTKLKVKESSYDKLSNDTNKTISDLRKQVTKLEEKLEKESNKGLFNRFK